MRSYLKLLRLEDQYIQAGVVFAAGAYTGVTESWFIWWVFAVILLGLPAFMANELTDSHDTDQHSWNKSHFGKAKANYLIVHFLFVLFSAAGLIVAFMAGLLWWGLVAYLLGLAYSVKPIRLKQVAVLDIVAQLGATWLLPFMAVLWRGGYPMLTAVPFILTLSCLMWALFLPYQLADFQADRTAGLKNTHIRLGLTNSLWFGLGLAVIGIVSYIFHASSFPWWTLVIVLPSIWVMTLYHKWLRYTQEQEVLVSLRLYVKQFKPVTQLMLPFFAVVWLVGL